MTSILSAAKALRLLFCFLLSISALTCFSQTTPSSRLEKMPVKLETDFALSALPAHLRQDATVYLLNPNKGFYVAHKGSNGFICFVLRTEWEWGAFSQDIATPISFDAEGADKIFPVYQYLEAMRAAGKLSAPQIRDSIVSKIKKGLFQAPRRSGISYMLAPIMRTYSGKPGDTMVMTMSMPHYMFYAPYLTSLEIGSTSNQEAGGPVVVNQGDALLGTSKGPFGYIILPAGSAEKTSILNSNHDLIKRLAEYKSYLKIDMMQH
jgi:hypothetical protein